MAIRTTAEGTYRAEFKRSGHRSSKTFKRKKDAQSWLAQQEVAFSEGSWADPKRGKVTPDELFPLWMSTRQVSGSTLATDRATWRGQVAPVWGTVPISSITTPALRRWVAQSQAAPSTRKHALRLLRGVLGMAVEEGRIPRNPATGIRVEGSKSSRAGQALSPDELRRFLELLTPPWGDLALVMATTGLRGSEIAALDEADVLQHDDGLALAVRKRWVTDDGGSRVLLPGTKGGSAVTRSVPVLSSVAPIITARLSGSPSRPLFRSPRGERLDWRNVRRDSGWKAAAAAVGRPGLRTHDLRHTCATLLLRASGGDVKAVQSILGHATASVTLDVYGHVLADGPARAVAALGVMLDADRARIGYPEQQ